MWLFRAFFRFIAMQNNRVLSMKSKIKIGITDCARYANYEKWFLDAPESVDVICLSYRLNNADDVEKCDGICLSGGEDVHPKVYKKPEVLEKLNLVDIDENRDDFELKIIEKALKNKLPILGICRGMQLFNCYLGGTLMHDIPSVTQLNGHGKVQGIDQRHDINVAEKTLLNEITGCLTGAVNSSHHQCVETLANDLLIAAKAEDPVVEATQWKDIDGNSFFLGVQWHPERMPDQDNPFASKIRQAFLAHIIEKSVKSNTTVIPTASTAC
ncbi:unnamed protein product [Didymodactylos carnosus]|uniref:Gamma-glutamyl-gamma-aminobutyrate hydrolase family protein n=2 Tax=Didymodactylos carnosus TaxID=1234261 RepID=A0A814KY92_9BILA|nr:unnamed protein product [Didymodactylos carnosus]CAF3826282.1 unnamed protein product [Didymodactylos carnosus]